MKSLAAVLLLFILIPCAGASVEWSSDASFQAGSGNVSFSDTCNATEVTIDTYTNFYTLNGVATLISLAINTTGLNATVTTVTATQLILSLNATSTTESMKVSSGTRAVYSVGGAAGYSGTPTVTITPTAGSSTVTILWTGALRGLTSWFILATIALLLVLIFAVRRHK